MDLPGMGASPGDLQTLAAASGGGPQLGLANQWPACVRRGGLFPLRRTQRAERALLGEFLYRLHGRYLVSRYPHGGEPRDPAGSKDPVFPYQLRPRPRNLFLWDVKHL